MLRQFFFPGIATINPPIKSYNLICPNYPTFPEKPFQKSELKSRYQHQCTTAHCKGTPSRPADFDNSKSKQNRIFPKCSILYISEMCLDFSVKVADIGRWEVTPPTGQVNR